MRIALFQPDIPQNTGSILRFAACLGVAVELIEPAGFDLSDAALRRAGLDYLDHVALRRHESWDAFVEWQHREQGRLILLTTSGTQPYFDFSFTPNDIILLGRESAGVPQSVHEHVDFRLTIPMRAGLRSLNVAMAGAMVVGEALRQTGGLSDL